MLVPWYAYCVRLRNVYDVCGDGEHPSKCNARRMRTMRVNLRRTHTGADPTSPYAKRQARHEHAARDAIRLITQFVPYRRNATDLGLLHYVPEPANHYWPRTLHLSGQCNC